MNHEDKKTILLKALKDSKNDSEALAILQSNPELTSIAWQGEDDTVKGSTPLHYAAHYNLIKCCEFLISKKADIEVNTYEWYRTPLSWAADYASIEALELLLRHGADVHSDIGHGYIALHAVAAGGQTNGKANPDGYVNAARVLIKAGSEIEHRGNKFGKTPLDIAKEYGNNSVEEFLKAISAKESN